VALSQRLPVTRLTSRITLIMRIIMAMTAVQENMSIIIIVAKKATSKIIITMMTSNIIVN
jgi:hypothetical protein